MKKYVALILSLVMIFALVACSANNKENETTSVSDSSNISTTIANSEDNTEEVSQSSSNNDTSTSKSTNSDKKSEEGLSKVQFENANDVTNSDGSMKETVIGTTKNNSSNNNNGGNGDWGNATTAHQGFQTEEIPIG